MLGGRAIPSRLLLWVLWIVLVAACTPKEAVVQERTDARTIAGRLSVKVTGAVSFEFDKKVDLRLVTILPHEKKLRLLSVGIVQLENLNETDKFKVAFDLVGVYAGRPGDFTIPVGKSDVPTLTATPVTEDDPLGFSNAIVSFFRLKDPAKPLNLENLAKGHEFNVALAPCKVKVRGERESEGEVSCPKLKDPAGNTVRFDMSWKVDPKASPRP